jgi:HEAT repeat protein
MDPVGALGPIIRGDPIEAMETAKQIIGHKLEVDPAILESISLDTLANKWSRISAIYVLGFLGDKSVVPSLVRVLSDPVELLEIRTHAAEALGNIGDPLAIPSLIRELDKSESPQLRKWCRYALKEIDPNSYFKPISNNRPKASRPRKYDALREYLAQQSADECELSFDEIELMIGSELPASAEKSYWWSNVRSRSHGRVQREAWRAAGYDAFLIPGSFRVKFRRTGPEGDRRSDDSSAQAN